MASPSVGDGSAKHIDGKPVDCALHAYFFFFLNVPPSALRANLLMMLRQAH